MPQYIGLQTRPLVLCVAIGVAVCDGACEASRDGGRRAVGEARTVAVATGSLALSVSAGPRKRGSVPSGATVVLLSNANVCASAYHPGDGFTATVTDTAHSPSGAVIPAGSLATFSVTAVSPPTATDAGAGRIGITLDSLDIDGVRYPATAQITSVATRRVHPPRAAADPTRTGNRASDGRMLGEPLGHGLQPSGVGAVTAPGSSGAPDDVCIPRRGRITVALPPL
jgi:hypothetical protein